MDNADRFFGSQYLLVEQIGSGAMGQVWLASRRADASSSPASPSQLAVKLLRPDLASDPGVVRRFVQEREVLMGLEHRGIVSTVDMVAEGHRLGIVMEFMPGGTLAEALQASGTIPGDVAVPTVAAVLDALAYAHGRGVLHRDVKPANVLMGERGLDDPAAVKLGDFGIASFSDEHGLHSTGLVGSPAYMPPELFTSGKVSAASDVYAAGVMLYELLAGRTPFAGPGTAHTLGYRHVTLAPPVLPVDSRLWIILERMLAKQPQDRPLASAAAEELRHLPADALAEPALIPQDTPDWDAAGTIIGLSPRITGGHKPNSGSGSASSGGSVSSDLSDLSDGADPNSTILGGVPSTTVSYDRLADTAKAKPKTWMIVVIVVVVLAMIIGGVLVAVKSGAFHPKAEESAAPTWAPAHVVGQVSATGLRVDLEAAAGDTGTVDLTVTLNAPRSTGLSGDVLIVVPSASGGTCPAVSGVDWETANQSTDGVGVPCAYKWAATLTAGQTLSVRATVTGDVGDDLATWLGSINSQTGTALSGVTGSGFALQRITGLSVQADPLKRTADSVAVTYRVFAQWSGGQQLLFRNDTLAFQATDLLLSLTGGDGLSDVKVDSCPQTQVNGIVVLALQPTYSCYVKVTIGDLSSSQAPFSIDTAGS